MNRALPSPPTPSPLSSQPSSSSVIQNVPLSIAEETESPPQKKHKIDEGGEKIGTETSSDDSMSFTDEGEVDDDSSSPLKSPLKSLIYSDYDSEEDYCPAGTKKMDKALWERYYKQIKESQGFDITDYPGGCWMTTVFPMPNYLNDPKNADKLKGYAGKALKHYNNTNATNYEVENVLKVNGGGCSDFIYYLTFSVKNGEHDVFQAKVVEDLKHNLEFPIVRPKVKDVNE